MSGIGHNRPPPANAMEDAIRVVSELRAARGERTQENVASRSAMTRQALQQIEAGTVWPRLYTACRHARALGFRVALIPVEEGQ